MTSTCTIYEFSNELINTQYSQKYQRYVSGGYGREVGPSNHPVPNAIQNAVNKNLFRINDNYPPEFGQIALIARDIDQYSVLAVATRESDDGNRPLVAYRYFWLDKSAGGNFDGIGTLLLWWLNNSKPQFEFKQTVAPKQLVEVLSREQFDWCRPQVRQLLQQITYYPFAFLIQQRDKLIQSAGLHYLALELNQRYQTPLAWAWNVSSLEAPKEFSLICCANNSAYNNVNQRLKGHKVDLVNQAARSAPALQSAENRNHQSQERGEPSASTRNLAINLKESIKKISQATNSQIEQSQLLKLVNILEENLPLPNNQWDWNILNDQRIISHIGNESAMRYKALLVLLNPQEDIHSWLKNVNSQRNSDNIKAAAINVQAKLLDVCCQKNKKNAYRWFNNRIYAEIIQLLLECNSEDTAIRNYACQNAEWLFVQSNKLLDSDVNQEEGWSNYFKEYVRDILNNLVNNSQTNDDFVNKLLTDLQQYKESGGTIKFPEYEGLASLFAQIKAYDLSAISYQLSQGNVPQNIYDEYDPDLIKCILPLPLKLAHSQKPKKKAVQKLILKFLTLRRLSKTYWIKDKWFWIAIILMIAAITTGSVAILKREWLSVLNIISSNSPTEDDILESNTNGDSGITNEDSEITNRDSRITNDPQKSELNRVWEALEKGNLAEKVKILEYLKKRESETYKKISQSFTRTVRELSANLPIDSGSNSSEIKAVQEILSVTGHYTKKIDGDFGPGTIEAVEAFQKSKNLPQTGKVDQNTWKKLSKSSKDEQVKVAREFLIQRFTNSQNNQKIKSDINNLKHCKKATTGLKHYINCVKGLLR